MYELENVLRPYAWVSKTAIAGLLGRPARLATGLTVEGPARALRPVATPGPRARMPALTPRETRRVPARSPKPRPTTPCPKTPHAASVRCCCALMRPAR